jgi:hypothetical protein
LGRIHALGQVQAYQSVPPGYLQFGEEPVQYLLDGNVPPAICVKSIAAWRRRRWTACGAV